jgi:transposase
MVTTTPLLTPQQWAAISPLLPAEPTDAQPPNRQFLEGVITLWLNGQLWKDSPPELGDYKKAYKRAVEWGLQGIWGKVAALLPATNPGRQVLLEADREVSEIEEDLPVLTEAQWAIITHLLPAEPRDSQPTNRLFVDGVLWMRFEGATWELWPTELGDSKQARIRAHEWAKQGIWVAIAATLSPTTTLRETLLEKIAGAFIDEGDLIDSKLLGQLRPTTRAAAANSTFMGTDQPTQEDSQY